MVFRATPVAGGFREGDAGAEGQPAREEHRARTVEPRWSDQEGGAGEVREGRDVRQGSEPAEGLTAFQIAIAATNANHAAATAFATPKRCSIIPSACRCDQEGEARKVRAKST
jgi:hypothetical protein